MTYEETVEYLFGQLPMFQRSGAAAYKPDLSRTLEMLDLLGNPHHNQKYIHVAGTNGKGSVCHLLAAALQTAGYKTGLFTSPHYADYRERIRINGTKIPKTFIVDYVRENRVRLGSINPSFFEWSAALAFSFFNTEATDIAVIETGLGGRLDSTNVITPVISIITNIGLDHQEFLGDTIEAIAAEKAGIIKENVPVIIGSTNEKTRPVFTSQATSKQAPLHFVDPLEAQAKASNQNEPTVIKALSVLNECSEFSISASQITEGIAKTSELTGFWGRMVELKKEPRVIVDSAHNAAGLQQLIAKFNQEKDVHVVFGTTHANEFSALLLLFPIEWNITFTTSDLPRMMQLDAMRELLSTESNRKHSFNANPVNAVQELCSRENPPKLILVCGSVFTAAAFHPENLVSQL